MEGLLEKWNEISDDKKNILGRPNFMCARIAYRLREMGYPVRTKAEDEQAVVLFVMLEFLEKYGPEWADKMNEYLKQAE